MLQTISIKNWNIRTFNEPYKNHPPKLFRTLMKVLLEPNSFRFGPFGLPPVPWDNRISSHLTIPPNNVTEYPEERRVYPLSVPLIKLHFSNFWNIGVMLRTSFILCLSSWTFRHWWLPRPPSPCALIRRYVLSSPSKLLSAVYWDHSILWVNWKFRRFFFSYFILFGFCGGKRTLSLSCIWFLRLDLVPFRASADFQAKASEAPAQAIVCIMSCFLLLSFLAVEQVLKWLAL